MKGKVKKNQLIIVALAVMIAAAGYLNYTGRLFGENAKGTKEANANLPYDSIHQPSLSTCFTVHSVHSNTYFPCYSTTTSVLM